MTRRLCREIRSDRITACDVDREAVRFCVREFGVHGHVAPPDVADLVLPGGTYDLIFVGSLLTHLDPAACLHLLDVLSNALRSGGVLVFTTHGESCLERIAGYGADFARREHFYRDTVAREGVAYAPYQGQRGYGITIHARSYVEAALAERFGGHLEVVRFAERGWDDHHVWSVRQVA